MKTVTDYVNLFTAAGGRVVYLDDVSKETARTWDICLELIGEKTSAVWALATSMGSDFIAFLHAFRAMQRGFAVGAFRFTIVIGEKPFDSEIE